MKKFRNPFLFIILSFLLFLAVSLPTTDAFPATALSASTDITNTTSEVPDSTGTIAGSSHNGIFLARPETGFRLLADAVPDMDKPLSKEITLMAVGDNLMHMGIVNSGKQPDGSYCYDFLYTDIADFLQAADIKVINQETILAGNERGFSGYPRFNSPTEVGDAIANAGFNVVLHASNHAADQGLNGMLSCIDFWAGHPEVLMTGIQKEPDNADEIPLITIEGVTFAILNYTYGPNAEVLPASIEGHLNMLCNYDEHSHVIDFTTLNPRVCEDIRKARKMADVVVVFPHWGTEYQTQPSTCQKQFAIQMTEAGADLIIGTHPHVAEPIEWIEADNGNRALCYYSLGNYISTQKSAISMLEGMAWITFRVTGSSITIDTAKTGVIPLVCQYKSNPVSFDHVYLLEDYTQELCDTHGIRSYGGVNLKLNDLQKWSGEIFGDYVLSKDTVLK